MDCLIQVAGDGEPLREPLEGTAAATKASEYNSEKRLISLCKCVQTPPCMQGANIFVRLLRTIHARFARWPLKAAIPFSWLPSCGDPQWDGIEFPFILVDEAAHVLE